MFYGREKELEQLNSILNKSEQAILLYGKRRVGKTALIKQAILSCSDKYVYYECIKDSIDVNLREFINKLSKQSNVVN